MKRGKSIKEEKEVYDEDRRADQLPLLIFKFFSILRINEFLVRCLIISALWVHQLCYIREETEEPMFEGSSQAPIPVVFHKREGSEEFICSIWSWLEVFQLYKLFWVPSGFTSLTIVLFPPFPGICRSSYDINPCRLSAAPSVWSFKPPELINFGWWKVEVKVEEPKIGLLERIGLDGGITAWICLNPFL